MKFKNSVYPTNRNRNRHLSSCCAGYMCEWKFFGDWVRMTLKRLT